MQREMEVHLSHKDKSSVFTSVVVDWRLFGEVLILGGGGAVRGTPCAACADERVHSARERVSKHTVITVR